MQSGILACKGQLQTFEGFLDDVEAATVDATYSVALHPVAVTRSLTPSQDEVQALAEPFQRLGMAVLARGGTKNVRLFAYVGTSRGTPPPVGAFLWLPIHSGLISWWLLTTWRAREMAGAAIELIERGSVLPAAACARSLLETAAAARYDTKRWSGMWLNCRRYAPTVAEPVPSSIYRELHNYVVEMLVGGKFKGVLPTEISVLATMPVTRTNIQTCLDHLTRVNPKVGTVYDVLCNAVHPSVASTVPYVVGIEHPHPGEVRMRFERAGVTQSAISTGLVSTWEATLSAIKLGLEVVVESLDESLRSVDDLCLTARLGQLKEATYWRCITSPGRNERCPCRSGRKVKDCRHQWGAEGADQLQEDALQSRGTGDA